MRGAWQGANLLFVFSLFVAPVVVAQDTDPATVTLDRIHGSEEFRGDSFEQARWLEEGTFYTTLEPSEAVTEGLDLVRYETESGVRTTLVSASLLMPEGFDRPLSIKNYQWSPDGMKLLIFTNSRRVWRQNTRGDYWILDLENYDLRQIGADRPEASLMFAKFDPAGGRVGYVSEHDVYVEDVVSGSVVRLTNDGSKTLINGTFDWVYEEEFFYPLQADGWRWSPDGTRIAYWQLDAEGVRHFLMMNNTDSVYSYTIPVEYPKAGETNSAARVGVVSSAGGETTWCDVPGDLRNNYIPRMEWSGNSDEVVIQRMNRHQNENRVMLCDAATGSMQTILAETDPAYLDAVSDWQWLRDDREFTWVSERTGWRHLYRVSRDGDDVRAITDGEWEIIGVQRIDEDGGRVYFTASPETATQRYLYRAQLNGRGDAERLTPEDQPGTHGYNISPDARFALHTYSSFGSPSVTELIRLPDHEVIRTLVDNRKLRETVDALDRGDFEFFQVDIGDAMLDAWMMYPPDFDPSLKYPILFYGYSEPWGQTVQDAWSGYYLWHLMLTQQGYIVASIDNRGTPGPRGRDWRKALYRNIGQLNVADLSAAARVIIGRPYVDADRVGTWGWSGGGEMALNLLFQYPDVYGTAIAIAAVSHQKYYDTIYTERYMGLPGEAAEDYEAGAPLTHAKNLEGNLLLVHGTADDNVHYQNFEALVNELIKHNKHFTMLSYPNRSHGIREGEGTRKHLYTEMTRYLNENMAPGGIPEESTLD